MSLPDQPPDLAPMLARCEAATPGPWRACNARDGKCTCGLIWSTTDDVPVAIGQGTDNERDGGDEPSPTPEQRVRNQAFIAHARTDLPVVIAALQRERTLSAELAAALRKEEWSGRRLYRSCRACFRFEQDGHTDACERRTALAAYDAARQTKESA